jgi:hypothetical protein
MREYKFDVELQALRERLCAEHNLTRGQYIQVNHETVRPLVILMEKSLSRIRDHKARREMRLELLTLWIERRINSSNDLTVYQCSTILSFLEYNYQIQTIGDRAKRFLSDSQAKIEGSGLFPEELPESLYPDIPSI